MTYEELRKWFKPMNEEEQFLMYCELDNSITFHLKKKGKWAYMVMQNLLYFRDFFMKNPEWLEEIGGDDREFKFKLAQKTLTDLKKETGYVAENEDGEYVLNIVEEEDDTI